MGKFYSLLTSVGIYEQNLSLPSYEMDLKLMENALIEGLRLSKDTIRTLGNCKDEKFCARIDGIFQYDRGRGWIYFVFFRSWLQWRSVLFRWNDQYSEHH